MRRLLLAAAVLLCFFVGVQAFGQTDATLSGTVSDSTGAVIPGVTVTATNDNTGVVMNTTTNQAGLYNFPRLLPGTYTVRATQQGFQPQVFTKVALGTSVQARLNMELQVGGVATNVEVSTSAEQLLLESSSSVGDVLSQEKVAELPLVNRNALDLVKIMSGVVMADDTIFNANASTFAGVGAAGVNIQRDGVTVNDVRWPAGINAATRVNPDLVGEFRMILAPVDAEVGRGNAQIQISTKAGTNEYHGGLVWNVQNTALDPNTWDNNRTGAVPPWRNMHQVTASVGGPIIKNKTFFFVLYDAQLNKIRTPYTALALTPCAAKGIFRFFDKWNNGNALQLTDPATPRIAVVDSAGNPLQPKTNPDGTPYTSGPVRYAYVFGQLKSGFTADNNCSSFNPATDVIPNTIWDPNRRAQNAYITDFLKKVPLANNYNVGDGLNAAGVRWSRTLLGADNLFGVGEDTYRRQINTRIDHNFNAVHRIHGSWSWEKSWADDNFVNVPGGYGGQSIRRPMVLTVNFLSSLKANLLNEARFGMSRTGSNIFSPYTHPDTGAALQALLPKMGTVPVVVGPGLGVFNMGPENFGGNASGYYGGRGILSYSGMDTSPRWTYGDTISWTKGEHSFRWGGEYRIASSEAKNQWTGPFVGGYNSYPYAAGGEQGVPQGIVVNGVTQIPGLVGTGSTFPSRDNVRGLYDLMDFQAGSLAELRQWRYINSVTDTTWNDPIKDPAIVRNVIEREFSLFFKDDWKIRPDLTLNLGVRYDYYGVPYLDNGLTTAPIGGGDALFGLSGNGFDSWNKPISKNTVPTGKNTTLQFVGPSTSNSSVPLYPHDWNNISPAVGFAYQLPWLGKGKTTIRGGYQISYLGNTGNFSGIQTAAGEAPGTTLSNRFFNNGSYFDISILNTLKEIPVDPSITPGIAQFPLTNRLQSITAYSSNYVAPYIQNITFAVTRNLTSNLMVDLRYVGTLSRKQANTININFPNYTTNGLLAAFNEARAGRNPKLLDDLFMGQYLTPWYVGGQQVSATYSGGQALRDAAWANFSLPFGAPGAFTNFNSMLANGNYAGLVNALNSYAPPLAFPSFASAPAGQLIRNNGFPENFMKTNPQFDNASLNSNGGSYNYHSFQGQITLRPTHGMSFQSTYTWAKNLGTSGAGYSDPGNLRGDYTSAASDRRHNWVTYGTFDLPFGPGRTYGKSTSGAVARIIGDWQMSWITTVQSGSPLNVTASTGLYGVNVPDVVGDGFDFNSVGVAWPDGALAGNYFGNRYVTTADPQCSGVWAGGQALCALQAIKDAGTNKIVLQNPVPGTRGNFGFNRMFAPMRWNVDISMAKGFQVTESKAFRLRVDFTNIFNHPQASGSSGSSGTRIVFPTAPSTAMSGIFGNMPVKVGGRTFQAMLRFDF